MYCTECGTGHEAGARQCSNCGVPLLEPPAAAGEEVESHLAAAILVTLCCCVPFGIPAIVYAAGVGGKLAAGDVAGARAAAAKARTWAWIGFGSGLAFWILYMIFALVAGAAGGLD